MSEPLRVALVVEGPTDSAVIEAAISRILEERTFVPTQLQPEQSLAFGPFGGGWGGVFRWCQQGAKRAGGFLSGDVLFNTFDLLVLHLDADVADSRYADINIQGPFDDLPCAEPCPPPGATTDRLRRVLLGWSGETNTPRRTVLCIPSKNTGAWVLAALYPDDHWVQSGNLECLPEPEVRFGQQPIRRRIRKSVADYKKRGEALRDAWDRVTATCTEAQRFSDEFRTAVANSEGTGGAAPSGETG